MRTFPFSALVLFCLSPSPASAGPYTDTMSQCFVESSTGRDRIDLIRWIVLASAKHPSVANFVKTDPDAENDIYRRTAKLFTRLVAEDCRTESADAVRFEGDMAIENAFFVLGEVASQELFLNENVNSAVTGFSQYIDEEKFNEIFE